MKRIVSLWLPSWPTDRLNRRRPLPAETPTVTVEEVGGRALIVAPNGMAAAGGILPGLSLADARALLPGLAVFPADPAGDAAGFPANDLDGHCLQNRSGAEVTVLEIGTRMKGSVAYYPDIDMVAPAGGKPAAYTHRDGTPYSDIRRRGPED